MLSQQIEGIGRLGAGIEQALQHRGGLARPAATEGVGESEDLVFSGLAAQGRHRHVVDAGRGKDIQGELGDFLIDQRKIGFHLLQEQADRGGRDRQALVFGQLAHPAGPLGRARRFEPLDPGSLLPLGCRDHLIDRIRRRH